LKQRLSYIDELNLESKSNEFSVCKDSITIGQTIKGLTEEQLFVLEQKFKSNFYLNNEERDLLSFNLGLSKELITKWFIERQTKYTVSLI
jgi:hypothetical protein